MRSAANLQVVYERRAEKRAWMDAHQCNVRVPLRGERGAARKVFVVHAPRVPNRRVLEAQSVYRLDGDVRCTLIGSANSFAKYRTGYWSWKQRDFDLPKSFPGFILHRA
jgi:hypothetical protein